MKRSFIQLFLVLILVISISSCSIEKRMYSSGYSLQWKKWNQTERVDVRSENQKLIETFSSEPDPVKLNYSENIIASADNSEGILKEEKIAPVVIVNDSSKTPACDIILLKNGDEISAKVLQVGIQAVNYKKCENQDGPIYSVSKSTIFMIKYSNGTKDVFSMDKDDSKPYVVHPSVPKRAPGMSVASLLCGIIGVFIAGLPLGILALIFGAIGLNKTDKHPELFNSKGLAIAGIILGMIDVIAILIILS